MKQNLVFFLVAFCGLFYVKAEECCPCPETPKCTGGWEAWNGHCYTFVKAEARWDEARAACLHLGGHLVKIGTQYENDYIVGSIKEYNMEKPWIGLRQLGGRWQWTDGSGVVYSDWNEDSNEPSGDGDCTQIRDDLEYHWNDEPCYRKNGYICEQD